MLHHEPDRSGLDRALGELVPVEARARDAEEERPRPDGAGVVGEILDLDLSIPHDLARREDLCDAFEVHWGAASVPMSPASAEIRMHRPSVERERTLAIRDWGSTCESCCS